MSHMQPYEYNAHVMRVVDGDTLDVKVDLGFTIHMDLRIRIAGVDTPEIYGVKQDSEEYKKGMAASEFVKSLLPEGAPVTIRTYKTGKYGRWVADVLTEDGTSIGHALIAEGHAEWI